MKNKYTIVETNLIVKGVTWGGHTTQHVYPILQQDAVPTTLKEALAKAGDFETLKSAKIVSVTKEIIEETTKIELK